MSPQFRQRSLKKEVHIETRKDSSFQLHAILAQAERLKAANYRLADNTTLSPVAKAA